jgi:hypothetical protein
MNSVQKRCTCQIRQISSLLSHVSSSCLWQYSSLIMSISCWTHQEMSTFFFSNMYWISLEELWWLFFIPRPLLSHFVSSPSQWFFFLLTSSINQAQKYDIKTHSAIMKARIVSRVLDFFKLMQHLQAKRIHL